MRGIWQSTRAKGAMAVAAAAAVSLVVVPIAGAQPGYAPFQPLPVPSGSDPAAVAYTSVSCPSPGACTAAVESSSGLPFVVGQSSGAWGTPEGVPLPAGGVTGTLTLTCAAVGECLAAGSYTTSDGATLPMLVEESAGTWGTATTPSLPADAVLGPSARAELARPWCASPGNCEVVGEYDSTGWWELMSATETAGVWGPLTTMPSGGTTSSVAPIQPTPFGVSLPVAFTCTSTGDCVAVSDSATWSESGGTWDAPVALPAGAGAFTVTAVACADASSCVAVGDFWFAGGCIGACRPWWTAAAATSANGTWGAPEQVGGVLGTFSGVACASGTCEAVGSGGSYNDDDAFNQPFAATWTGGSWTGNMEVTPVASPNTEDSQLDDVACVAATQCLAVGELGQIPAHGGFAGGSPYEVAITPVSAATTPGAPTSVLATPRIGGAVLWWSPPTVDGGSPIVSYTATITGGPTRIALRPDSCTTTTNSCELHDLDDGHQYVVVVTADNGTATSARAFSNHFFAGAPPTTPSHVQSAVTASGARISWQHSRSPANEPVLRYEVTATSGRQQVTCLAAASASSCVLHHLTSGRTYQISVAAYDVSGWSAPAVLDLTAS